MTASDYQLKAVTLMAFGYALVNIDRFILFPLYPLVMKDLDLDYDSLGWLSGIVAFGGGLLPSLAGTLAKHQGIQIILPMVLACSIVGLLISFAQQGGQKVKLNKDRT